MHVTVNGQITIPPEIQQQLALFPGTEVELEVVGDALYLRKKSRGDRGEQLIALMQGTASSPLTTDEITTLTRSDA